MLILITQCKILENVSCKTFWDVPAPTDQWISRRFLFLLIIVYLSQCRSVALKKGFDPKICACFALSLSVRISIISVKISILFNLFSALVRFQNISTSASKFSQLCFGGGGWGSVFTECKLVFYTQPTSAVISGWVCWVYAVQPLLK